MADLDENVPRHMPEQIDQLVQSNRAFASANSSLRHDNAALRSDNLDLQARLDLQQQELETLRMFAGGGALSDNRQSTHEGTGHAQPVQEAPGAVSDEWLQWMIDQDPDEPATGFQHTPTGRSNLSPQRLGEDGSTYAELPSDPPHGNAEAPPDCQYIAGHHASPTVTASTSTASTDSGSPPTVETSTSSFSDSTAASSLPGPTNEMLRPVDPLLCDALDQDDILRGMDECVTGITGEASWP